MYAYARHKRDSENRVSVDRFKANKRTYLDRHLVNVDTLLDTELRYIDVEGRIENTNNLCLADDGTIALSEIGDEDAKEEMSRLLLCQLSRILFTVRVICISNGDMWKGLKNLTCCIAEPLSQQRHGPW